MESQRTQTKRQKERKSKEQMGQAENKYQVNELKLNHTNNHIKCK